MGGRADEDAMTGRAPDVDELLAQAPFVRRLAAGLLRDDNDVDDVVQQTWRATLRSPPRHRGALRSWLGRVVRSVVRERRRASSRPMNERGAAHTHRPPLAL